MFTAISAGTTTITAASGIVNGTATATVLTQPPGLVAYWNFNEGSGTTASDSSGNGNTGTIYGATRTTGKISSALQFSGANQYVRGNKIVNIPKATVEAWVYITSAPASSKLIAGFVNGLGSTREDKLLHITSGRRIGFTVWDGISDKTIISTSQIPLNTWTHVAGTADGTNARVYVNGVEAGSIAAGNTEADYTVPDIFIGGSSASFGYFSGKIDEVKIYNRSLSASEITDEYLQGT